MKHLHSARYLYRPDINIGKVLYHKLFWIITKKKRLLSLMRQLLQTVQQSILLHKRNLLSATMAMVTTSTTTQTLSSKATSPSRKEKIPVYIHSTFRDYTGEILKPYGLQWGIDGDSHLYFVPELQQGGEVDDETKEMMMSDGNHQALYRGIVEAYNRWCCAKDIPYFVKEDDIESIEWVNNRQHILVQWNKDHTNRLPTTNIRTRNNEAILQLLENDEAATGNGPSAEVWINGDYICELDGSKDKLGKVKMALAELPSTSKTKNFKRHSGYDENDSGLIRIERYYRGGIRQRPEVFDHVWDNLVCLEDPMIIDENTLIGTATLSDWIMGGMLTSRLWIRDDGDRILFLRPLRNDKVDSSDRRYELKAATGNGGGEANTLKKMTMVRKEIKRLRYLATLRHPYAAPTEKEMDPHTIRMAQVRANLRRNKNKGKFFAI